MTLLGLLCLTVLYLLGILWVAELLNGKEPDDQS